jgi:putative ubiquitin-RnfH superfamily antitoxin RatB of RatAB toxin-antitoxin module
MQTHFVRSDDNALHEDLVACQAKCLGLKQDVATQQHALQEAFAKATKVEKKHLNSMENIECYHQTLIDMKEYYRKDVETFVKATERNLNHMHLACILAISQATQMEAELIRM